MRKLTGKISPHSFLIGKLEDQGRRFWFQTNTEYPDREMVLALACGRRPQWQIEPPSAAKEARWDESTQTLNLRLTHQQGPAEVTVK